MSEFTEKQTEVLTDITLEMLQCVSRSFESRVEVLQEMHPTQVLVVLLTSVASNLAEKMFQGNKEEICGMMSDIAEAFRGAAEIFKKHELGTEGKYETTLGSVEILQREANKSKKDNRVLN